MAPVSKKQKHLEDLEREVRGKGVRLSYERLKFAGLILKSGLCWFRGNYYLFVDRLLPVNARIDLLEGALEELSELSAAGRLDHPPEAPEPAPEDGKAVSAPEEPAG